MVAAPKRLLDLTLKTDIEFGLRLLTSVELLDAAVWREINSDEAQPQAVFLEALSRLVGRHGALRRPWNGCCDCCCAKREAISHARRSSNGEANPLLSLRHCAKFCSAETTAFPGPGHWHLMDSVGAAPGARHAGHQFAAILKKVRMPPASFDGVMDSTRCFADRRWQFPVLRKRASDCSGVGPQFSLVSLIRSRIKQLTEKMPSHQLKPESSCLFSYDRNRR